MGLRVGAGAGTPARRPSVTPPGKARAPGKRKSGEQSEIHRIFL
jgi:hypothetical protein